MKPRPSRKTKKPRPMPVQELKFLCRVCRRNEARYTSGCCALCDMQLPEEERGERITR